MLFFKGGSCPTTPGKLSDYPAEVGQLPLLKFQQKHRDMNGSEINVNHINYVFFDSL